MEGLLFHSVAVLALLVSCVAHTTRCQTICDRQASTEWRVQQRTVELQWTLMENICTGVAQCWGSHQGVEKSSSEPPLILPQICPLQLQFGDRLFFSVDDALQSYGIKLINVSKENFKRCAVNQSKDHFLFSHNYTEHVDLGRLVPGQHYFVALHEGETQLCKLGLRLNVTVKEQLCQSSPLIRHTCSGNGVCQTSLREDAYHCRCRHHYSGRFCDTFDACLENPCENKGVCLSNGSSDPRHRTYKCLCPPHFTGVNCSEVIGKENCDRVCQNGTCVQASPASFKCTCDSGYSGSHCEKKEVHCTSNPCRNGGSCEELTGGGFVCRCPEGRWGPTCDSGFHSSDCMSYECQEEPSCSAGEHSDSSECVCADGSECVCADGSVAPACRRRQQQSRLCTSPSPCLNNGSCVSKGNDYACSCLPGFSGKNCEEIIDYCGLLNITCLNEGLCLTVIGGLKCVCAPGWTGELCQYVGDACLMRGNSCLHGGTCVTTSQPSSPPQHACICPTGFTGLRCETEINECDSSPCLHNGTCSDMLGGYTCTCLLGFLGKKCEVDVDACSLPNNTCPPNTQCLDLPDGLKYTCRVPCPPNIQPCANGGRCVLNSASSYTCACAPGWTGRNCRINVNDCVQHWCQNGATCVDQIDGYSCLCPRGYTGAFCEVDIDYCVDHGCSEHGACLDQRDNFTCRCVPGFQGPLCELETDECDSSPCVHGATCVDLVNDYQCHCPPGFEGRTCSQNVNDCRSQPCLNGGSCVDLINDYFCNCRFGFKGKDCSVDLDLCSFGLCTEHSLMCTETSDGQNVTCLCEKGFGGAFCEVNLNECESGPCQHGAICVDGVDAYQCFCSDGFVGVNCEINHDECALGHCVNNSTCIDRVAGYECICPSGFTGKNCSSPVPGCAADENFCKNGGTCSSNITGETQCVCPSGFQGVDCSSAVNGCVSNPCDPEGTLRCEDLNATYTCVCRHGLTGRHCENPISHCVDHLCHRGSKCTELPGGFKCDCLPGLTGQFCEVNIGDCEDKPCGALSVCKDTFTGYSCFCAPGFIGNSCELEVNECLSQPCQNGGSCVDDLDSFSCHCPPGITGSYCEINIDECLSSPCLHSATCIDRTRGYECVCSPGFTGDACELDVDECASSPCQNEATCIDQPGNYFCQCVAPFKGRNCEFLPCEANNPCENGAECVEEFDQDHFPLGFRCRCGRGFAGPRCEINVDECQSGPCLHGFCYDVVDGFYCLCNPGYAGPRCEQDIDDCASNLCTNNSTCKDHHLRYECVCQPGWEGEFCQREIDECLSQPCKNNATCTDLHGGYKCVCARGWTGARCEDDVKECSSGPCLNGGRCREDGEAPGEFSCTCPAFFSGPLCAQPYDPCDPPHNPCRGGSTCLTRSDGAASCRCPAGLEGTRCEIDTDECSSSPCRNHGGCRDQVNGYSCECKEGFSGLHCEEDINECASSPCQNAGICQDHVNRFRCVCPPGYFGSRCDLDVNECEGSPCLHEGVCFNKPGGFSCVCRPGYSGDWCEVNIDECLSNPCQNGGRCIDGPGGYGCSCPSGFEGLHCQSNVDECMSGPCLHGSCVDGPGSFSCLCERGWTGSSCERNIDECASGPCLRGGSCVDLIDKYACFCPDGYTGRHCEIDIDVCHANASTTVSLCFNGATCVDGEGSNFTCSCPAGFMGDFCEVDVNECCSAPCLHGAVCQDLLNGYRCLCRPGWTGLHCEEDINECLPPPCNNQGMCIQNEPGSGYTCFCRPGFVGQSCEHNYDDCLSSPCPDGYSCVDGVNEARCVPAAPRETHSTNITNATQSFVMTTSRPTLAVPLTGPSYIQYFGSSYLEFAGVALGALNNITVRFQTAVDRGTVLYVDQGPDNRAGGFMKLFIWDGLLQYTFNCNQEEEAGRINTLLQVDDGTEYIVNVRQQLAPCEAAVTVLGYGQFKSMASNYWTGVPTNGTNHVFIGGLPSTYQPKQRAKPFYNYTGCIEMIEINEQKGFYKSGAISSSNVGNCRANTSAVAPPTSAPEATPRPSPPHLCRDGLCLNGGTCQHLELPGGGGRPVCDCPLHYTGTFCEKDTTVYIPWFNSTSYLELRSLASMLQSSAGGDDPPTAPSDSSVTLYLTVKTAATQGTLLYTQEQNFGDGFLHVFLEDGGPVAKLGCGGRQVLTAAASQNVNNDRWTSIRIRYYLPVGPHGGSCMIEIATDNVTAQRQEEYVFHTVSEATLGAIFLGNVPASHGEVPDSAVGRRRFIGCIRELQVNGKEVDLMGEALRGRNIHNCDPPVCQHLPCRNGGTCISDAEGWLCECPAFYAGRLCQFSACERNPCGHGATCLPKSPLEAVCLCPAGRQGLLCEEAINITRARFSGNDEFGWTSFVAYTAVPSLSLSYQFQLKLTLANNASALRDSLILFSGQKGQGNDGDDFLVVGIRNGRIVHKYNLGSGVATIVSDPLNRQVDIHTVHFGRSKRFGWLKVDGQRNRTGWSPGPLVGLNVFNQVYIGGYNEYTPELLPLGSRFRNGFQGCIFDVRFRTRRDGKFQALGQPEGHAAFGRSVGQCGVNPCTLVTCQNGGRCVDSGSSVYCQCPLGWKGALCSETVSACDVEHRPPPLCAGGSTCIPLPSGYTCLCPLGSAGLHCREAMTISDPYFSGNQSSWMSFSPVSMRHSTVLELQFQPLSPDGILVYIAQHLSSRAGDFFCLSLTSGFVQLRYNLGDSNTHVLQSVGRVDHSGRTWHRVRAGRTGHRGFLSLDEQDVIMSNVTEGMKTLDVATDIFIGGASSLSAVSPDATENEPTGFTGGVRELVLNGRELELTESGALDGANVGDWDGTACGYKVCRNGGRCGAVGADSFVCACPAPWTGPVCNQSVNCVNHLCKHGALCAPNRKEGSYQCMCPLGREGRYCEEEMALHTLRFVGNSYVKYQDPRFSIRNLRYTQVSFSFYSHTNDSMMIMWIGKAEHEDDYLTIGLEGGFMKVVVNLGERLSLPVTFRNVSLCCNRWHRVSLSLNTTVLQVSLDDERIISEDVDPFERYVALNYGGVFYFGGFELNRNVATVSSGLFSKGFVGNLKNVYLYQDPKQLLFSQNSEGFNVFNSNQK